MKHDHRDNDAVASAMTFEEFHDMAVKDLHLNEANVMMKSLEIPMLLVKYNRFKKRQERQVKIAQTSLDNLCFRKMEWARFESKKDYSADKKFDNFLKADPEYQDKKLRLDLETEFLGYIDRTLTTLNNMSFHITNYRNMKGFNLGE